MVVVLIVVYFAGAYNSRVTPCNACKLAFAQIDVKLTRRQGLIFDPMEVV